MNQPKVFQQLEGILKKRKGTEMDVLLYIMRNDIFV